MLTEAEILERLKGTLKPGRFEHTLNVVSTARRLAVIHNADEDKCALAALLHDCAKSMSRDEMLNEISKSGIELIKGEDTFEPILHAPAGAAIAQSVYGVNDTEVLSAIRKHTVGGKNMTLTEAIVYVADFIEPGRKPFDGLEEARAIAEKDIYGAVKKCSELTAEYCRSNGQPVFVWP